MWDRSTRPSSRDYVDLKYLSSKTSSNQEADLDLFGEISCSEQKFVKRKRRRKKRYGAGKTGQPELTEVAEPCSTPRPTAVTSVTSATAEINMSKSPLAVHSLPHTEDVVSSSFRPRLRKASDSASRTREKMAGKRHPRTDKTLVPEVVPLMDVAGQTHSCKSQTVPSYSPSSGEDFGLPSRHKTKRTPSSVGTNTRELETKGNMFSRIPTASQTYSKSPTDSTKEESPPNMNLSHRTILPQNVKGEHGKTKKRVSTHPSPGKSSSSAGRGGTLMPSVRTAAEPELEYDFVVDSVQMPHTHRPEHRKQIWTGVNKPDKTQPAINV